jgi:DNA-binding SARP family transcriptional activator
MIGLSSKGFIYYNLLMDILKILLLGPPAVFLGEQPVRIQRRLTRCLLFYLTCQRHFTSRSDLMLLLWPDITEETGRRRLREILSKLRCELPNPELLVADQDQVGLAKELLYSDVQEFESIYQATRGIAENFPIDTPLPDQVYNEMVTAVNLWRSPYFLAGTRFPNSRKFETWVGMRSTRLDMTRQLILERLADHTIVKGAHDLAVRWLMLALQTDELNIELNQKLLSCFSRLGRRREASGYRKMLRKLFQQEENRDLPEALENYPFYPGQHKIERPF